MDLVKGMLTSVRQFYNDINPATLTGAIDVIVVEKPNGDLASTPFHVRFGKINVMNFVGKTVEIYINEKPTDLRMKLGASGEAFFVEASDEEPPAKLATSPLPDDLLLSDNEQPIMRPISSPGLSHSSHSPRKRSDSSPAIVVKRRDSDSEEAHTDMPEAKDKNSTEVEETAESRPSGISPDEDDSQAKDNNIVDPKTTDASGSFNVTAIDDEEKPLDTVNTALGVIVRDQPATVGLQSLSLGTERTIQKVKKRRRKISKQVIPEKPTALNENSSSDAEETQFHMDGVISNDERLSLPMSLTASSATSPAGPTGITATTADDSSPVLSSQEMKTAKTTQLNVSTSPTRNSDSSKGVNRKSALEPVESNTSNTTVTSDDEFNWASVASGVAPARLTPAGSNLAAGTSLAVSDGDLSDNDRRQRNRPPSPARSDTLVELGHNNEEMRGVEWSWGELPEGEIPPQIRALSPAPGSLPETNGTKNNSSKIRNSNDKDNKKDSVSAAPSTSLQMNDGSITPTSTQPKQADGLYLDDVLAQTDPAMRERYIGSNPRRATPRTSARPTGHWDGESGNGPSLSQSPQSGLDSDCEPDPRHPVFDYGLKKYSDLAMSLCGFDRIDEEGKQRFLAHVITYDEFCLNPDILHEPNLVFRMNGKFYNWKCIAPQMLSLAMFQRPLPAVTMEKLRAEHLAKKKVISPPQVKSRGWWWSRGGPQEDVTDGAVEKVEGYPAKQDITTPIKGSKSGESKRPVKDTTEEKTLSDEELLANQLMEEELTKSHNRKSLRLSSDKLKSLGLKPGTNLAEFKVITAYQGTSVCSCHIYLWKSTDKIVISDIDGTITKSDVLGHILPIIGKDWAQSGVASLFNKIDRNGYKLIYLSARAIGQAQWTRGFLRSLKQDNLLLPDGPVLLNPTSLLSALHREVVAKSPHIFKINCLRDVKQLFNAPDGTPGQPFYAGFGNKMTDALSYKTVSVPVNRIFTINHRGEVSQELMGNVGRTYHCLGEIADLIFPPLEPSRENAKEQFSSFSYWKETLPVVEIEDLSKTSATTTDSAPPKPQSDSSPLKESKVSFLEARTRRFPRNPGCRYCYRKKIRPHRFSPS
ncbi:phosphatidate phosphatase LPIN1-like isoform X2 [Varroa jacobsoni]|uniref:phosphatidate phosphatase LPIN1-like isoform X2 n=1 Tax=Varroa jacobsoni TaxID=62625 RepID=UPI000BF30A2E|nr:phosphatidate phosphatase LPIN1-like isoform X2 [Varroa jacobsoni]